MACRQDMHNQPRYKPYAASSFFADGKSARELVRGTIPRDYTRRDRVFYTGRLPSPPVPRPQGSDVLAQVDQSRPPPGTPDKEQLAAWRAIDAAEAAGGLMERREREYVDALPASMLPLTESTLLRGQERFEIYCAVCHDRTGSGNGMIVRKGFTRPPSFHSERLRAAKLGHFFDVITNGFGAMPSYASQIGPQDRWAIVAYIRALQLSQWARIDELPAADRQALLRAAETAKGNTP
jgi:mono/diheme cytochrome c family protein